MKENKKRSTASWIFEFAGAKKMFYIFSILIAVIGVGFSILPYLVMTKIVFQLIDGSKDWSLYLRECGFMALFWLCRCVCHSISTTLSHVGTFNVLANIKNRCMEKFPKLPLGDVLERSSGSIKNVICERVDSIETTLAHVFPEFTAGICGALAIYVIIFTTNWKLGLISIGTLPLGIIFYCLMCVGYQESFARCVKSTKDLNDTAVEYINGIEVIKAFGKAESSYEKFVAAAKEGAACYVDWMKRCNVWFSFAMSITPAVLLSVLPLGGLMLYHGSINSTQLIMAMILSTCAITPLITVMSYTDDLAQIKLIIGEVTDILDSPELSRPSVNTVVPLTNEITLKNVHFGYKEKEILHGINMEIPAGKVTAIVGPSGSGKSTIAKLIASLWDVNGGSIEIGGVDVRNITLETLNNIIAYVNQDNYLFNKSVRENIRLGNPNATDAEVEEIAKKAGVYDFIMSLENGFETVCGGAGTHLSGGERQRISIARAMLKNAPIVILDEATAYTDPENEAIIQASVAKLVEGKTLIVIAHRLSTIINSDRIFVVNDGNIDSFGTHQQLLEKSALYKQMWEAHISVKDE